MSLNSGTAVQAMQALNDLPTRLPPSMGNDPLLYAVSLASVMCIACLCLAIAGWMARDTWRDRFQVHPNSLLFNFRLIFLLLGTGGTIRVMPEVLYLQMYADPTISVATQAAVITAKRIADTIAVWFVIGWMLVFVVIYPHMCVALKSGPAKYVFTDTKSSWPRLVRPFFCFISIAIVATVFAYAKVYGR